MEAAKMIISTPDATYELNGKKVVARFGGFRVTYRMDTVAHARALFYSIARADVERVPRENAAASDMEDIDEEW